jgi:hypothetical protein
MMCIINRSHSVYITQVGDLFNQNIFSMIISMMRKVAKRDIISRNG